MIRGWLAYRGVWRQTKAVFNDSHYCVAINLPDFGKSEKPADGQLDAMVPVSESRLIKQYVPVNQLVLNDEYGHFPMYEKTQQ